jgi:hypothetical protein
MNVHYLSPKHIVKENETADTAIYMIFFDNGELNVDHFIYGNTWTSRVSLTNISPEENKILFHGTYKEVDNILKKANRVY